MHDPTQVIAPSRRQFLTQGLGALGLSAIGAFGTEAASQSAPTASKVAKAKSVIQIWMAGGPSHLDTFDPKPDAGRDYCGPFANPIPSNVDGIVVSEALPLLAKQADKYSIIRSMTHGINAHETASYIMQTGREAGGGRVYPSIGAVVAMLKGHGYGYEGSLPPYMVLTEPQGRFSEAGFLGSKHKPFVTGGDPSKDPFLVSGYVVEGVSKQRHLERRGLLDSIDLLGRAASEVPLMKQIDSCNENAYKLILGDGIEVFDLTSEPEATRDRYGRNWFGQSCLMARRLAEQGVPWITINYRGWDTHKRHFDILARRQPEMDRGMATLLADLSERGLLDSTVVWWSGDFGRTPKVQWEAPWMGGRGHWGAVFSAAVAGGGFKGGQILGASNATGEEVAERPVYPQDLLGSIYDRLGIDPDGPMPNPQNLDVPIMAPPSKEGRLKEIMV